MWKLVMFTNVIPTSPALRLELSLGSHSKLIMRILGLQSSAQLNHVSLSRRLFQFSHFSGDNRCRRLGALWRSK